MVAMAKMNKGKKSGAAPTAAGREGGGRKGKGGAGKQRVGKGKGADDEDSEAEEKDLEVKESLWLGKALRRQQVAEEIEEQKAAKRQTGKEQGGAKGGDEDVTDESSEGEPEKLGSFTFDADDDTVDEVVSGWKFKGMGGAAHRPDYAGRLTGIDEKIKKRARKMEIEEDSDDEIAMRESDEDDDEEDGGESEEGKDDDDDDDEDDDEDEDEDDSAHQSEEEEDEDERLGSRIKEEESEEGEGGDDEDDEDDDEEESEEEEEEDEDKEAKVKEKKKQKEMMAEQLKREKEAAFFDDAPVPAASTQDTFASLHLSRPFLKATNAMGFTSPTSIQSMVIPIALQGKDVCASSRTGSGKTAAFSLPFLERLLHRPRRVACTRVLILTPTRELAVQGHAMIENLAQFTDIRCYIVIGGVKNQVQEIELRKKPDVVVATPGRMLDHLRNAAGISLDGLEILILDEADRLLEMGFTEEVEELVKLCPVKRQTMLFSATMTHDVDRLAAYSLKRPVRVTADSSIRTEEEGNLNKVAVPKTLNQEFIRIRKEHEGDREAILLCLCTRSFHTKTIIFCREKKRAHRLRLIFGLSNLKVDELHGNLTQAQRLESLESFKAGNSDFLIATDLAGRGLDVQGIDVVINFEVPRNVSEYVHRVGRTARAGRKGRAVTLADDSGRTKKMLKDIVRSAPEVVKRRVVPPDAIAEWKERIEEMQDDIDAIGEEEKVEKELRVADMEAEKATNMMQHRDEIMNRPKKTWFQTNQEKRETREKNIASSRRIEKDPNINPETGEKMITKKKIINEHSKKDKYAGLSRKKRRNAMFREEEEMDRKEMEKERQAAEMFEGEGPRPKPAKKPLSQKAMKAKVKRGVIDPEQQKADARKRRQDVKRKRQAEARESMPVSKKAKNDKELFQEAVDAELKGKRSGGVKTKNNKKARAGNKSFKSKTRMKRRK